MITVQTDTGDNQKHAARHCPRSGFGWTPNGARAFLLRGREVQTNGSINLFKVRRILF